jgi:hypothetical protein
MKFDEAFSQQHIYLVKSDKTYCAYRFNSSTNDLQQSTRLSIWQLIKGNKNFRVYLDVWGHKEQGRVAYTKAGRALNSIFSALETGADVRSLDINKAVIFIIKTSVGFYLKKLQTVFGKVDHLLTPQYKLIMSSMRFNLDKRDELIFHLCNFDCYVWVPAKTLHPKKMLVVFLTRNNTLNMPLAFGHQILASLGIALMYVDGKKNANPDHFVAGLGLEESAQTILSISKELGFNKLIGLGVSSGGFRACKLALLLQFDRVLNFSGAKKDKLSSTLLSMKTEFPQYKILSVLSEQDAGDRVIEQFYDQDNFNTPRKFVTSNTHGTFSAAYLEKKLTNYFNWLLSECDENE